MQLHISKNEANHNNAGVHSSAKENEQGDASVFRRVGVTTTQMKKLQAMADKSLQVEHSNALQKMADNSPATKRLAQMQAMANHHTIQNLQPNAGLKEQPPQEQVENNAREQTMPGTSPVQRRVGMEYETNMKVQTLDKKDIGYHVNMFTSSDGLWKIEADSSSVEFVTEPFETNDAGFDQLTQSVTDIVHWASSVETATAAVADNDNPALLEAVDNSKGAPKLVSGQKVMFPNKQITTGSIISSPQATGGVTLDKIPELFKAALTTEFPHLKNATNGYKSPWKLTKPVLPILEQVRQAFLTQDLTELDKELEELKLTLDDTNSNDKEDSNQELVEEDNNEEFIQQEFESLLESYNTFKDLYESQEKISSNAGIDPDAAPYTVSGMNPIDQPHLVSAIALAEEAVKSLIKEEDDVRYPKLQGLLTLIFSYMVTGANQFETYDYSKVIAPIMSRTNIKKLYDELDEHEKAAFTPEFVLSAVKLEEGQLFPRGFGNKLNEDKRGQGPSRQDWVHSIKEGTQLGIFDNKKEGGTQKIPLSKSQLVLAQENGIVLAEKMEADLLSKDSKSDVVKSYKTETQFGPIESSGASSSMGEQNALDRDGDTNDKLAVLELRRLPREQHIADWLETAKVVFNMFRKIKGG